MSLFILDAFMLCYNSCYGQIFQKSYFFGKIVLFLWIMTKNRIVCTTNTQTFFLRLTVLRKRCENCDQSRNFFPWSGVNWKAHSNFASWTSTSSLQLLWLQILFSRFSLEQFSYSLWSKYTFTQSLHLHLRAAIYLVGLRLFSSSIHLTNITYEI